MRLFETYVSSQLWKSCFYKLINKVLESIAVLRIYFEPVWFNFILNYGGQNRINLVFGYFGFDFFGLDFWNDLACKILCFLFNQLSWPTIISKNWYCSMNSWFAYYVKVFMFSVKMNLMIAWKNLQFRSMHLESVLKSLRSMMRTVSMYIETFIFGNESI